MAIVNRRLKVMHIISGDLWAGAEVQAYTLLKCLQSSCDIHAVLMNHGELADKLLSVGVLVTVLDEKKLGGLTIFLALRKIMRNFKPDIVHTHRKKENILGGFANLLSVRAKSVRTSHGAPEFTVKGLRHLQTRIDNFVGRYLQHAIIAVSNDLAEKLTVIFPSKKIYTISNGVDVDALKQSAGIADFRRNHPRAFHVGIVGRLERVKRVDIFLEMAAILIAQQHGPELRFHIIGDGKLRSELQAQSQRLNLESVVTFHGHRKDTAACISSLDAIVMCSDHEGMPMTALEAIALGVPLIAHYVGGLTGLLHDYPELQVKEHVSECYAEKLIAYQQRVSALRITLDPGYLSDTNAKETGKLYHSVLNL